MLPESIAHSVTDIMIQVHRLRRRTDPSEVSTACAYVLSRGLAFSFMTALKLIAAFKRGFIKGFYIACSNGTSRYDCIAFKFVVFIAEEHNYNVLR